MAALCHLLLTTTEKVRGDTMLQAISVILYALGTICGVALGSFFWKLVYKH